MQNSSFTVDELVHNPSFTRWVEGDESAQDDAVFWDHWILENEHNRMKALKAQQIITGLSIDGPVVPDVDQQWQAIRQNLNMGNIPLTAKEDRYAFFNTHHNAIQWVMKVAAILVFLITATWLFVPNQYYRVQRSSSITLQTITTDYKEKKTLHLSDGSTIVLAAGSQLSYASNWLDQPTKRLRLKGEAYFSIIPIKTKNHPKLIVKTEDGTAAVWGTKFNVLTSPEGTQVVLKKGEVKVDADGNTTTMHPGQMTHFKKSSSIITTYQVNPEVYTSWASDRLVFDQTPLSLLSHRIERTFDVQVYVANRRLLQKKLTGSVAFKDLDSLIRAVAEVLKISITRRDSAVFITNSK